MVGGKGEKRLKNRKLRSIQLRSRRGGMNTPAAEANFVSKAGSDVAIPKLILRSVVKLTLLVLTHYTPRQSAKTAQLDLAT